MDIVLENTSIRKIKIRDIGIELAPDETMFLLDMFKSETIVRSNDLESIYESGDIKFSIDGINSSFNEVVIALSGGLTIQEHENLDTLKHGLSESSFFQVERDQEDDVEKIVYYKDASLNTKIREDEIVRDVEGEVIQMIKRQYNTGGSVTVTEIQTINRVDGDVVSIETVTT